MKPIPGALEFREQEAIGLAGDLEGALRVYQLETLNSLTVASSSNNIGLVIKDHGDLEGASKNYASKELKKDREFVLEAVPAGRISDE